MNDKLFFQRSEQEMDFMPIIPINETEHDNLADTEIPKEIPILPLRNTVLFPGVVLPITVGRDKSIKAVHDAYKTDKLIGVLAQKDSSVEDPSLNELVAVGTIARIIKVIKMPDGGTTVILQGKRRFKVGAITTDDPYFRPRLSCFRKKKRRRIRILKPMFQTSRTSPHRLFNSRPISRRKRPLS
jgi:ATP-dependent Lon protease